MGALFSSLRSLGRTGYVAVAWGIVALSIARSSFRFYFEESEGSLRVQFGVMVGVVAACFVMLMRWAAP